MQIPNPENMRPGMSITLFHEHPCEELKIEANIQPIDCALDPNLKSVQTVRICLGNYLQTVHYDNVDKFVKFCEQHNVEITDTKGVLKRLKKVA